MNCFFASDLHGAIPKYRSLFQRILDERPQAVFFGGDLLPHWRDSNHDAGDDFVQGFLGKNLESLREILREHYPRIFLIPGNDDARIEEASFLELAQRGLFQYMHAQKTLWNQYLILGYACVPPTPFRLKDWERYDVSRYVDPGCYGPEEGWHSVAVTEQDQIYGTIQKDLDALIGKESAEDAICLFHSPPYKCNLDRAALDQKMIDHVPLDVHIGSIAIRQFIESRQPLLTLHGHVHESARITGNWKDKIGRTTLFSAAHDGPELALIKFDPTFLELAQRELIVC
ncbi:MAG TPA: metallophosphoesterase [Acidobacteriota bacterium]|nr:metallophosphoesterase [Acidobacteriota bacterium]